MDMEVSLTPLSYSYWTKIVSMGMMFWERKKALVATGHLASATCWDQGSLARSTQAPWNAVPKSENVISWGKYKKRKHDGWTRCPLICSSKPRGWSLTVLPIKLVCLQIAIQETRDVLQTRSRALNLLPDPVKVIKVFCCHCQMLPP